jgi:hypothetical protein
VSWLKSLVVGAIVAGCTQVAAAEDVVVLRESGPRENRISLVVLGDGYTDAELVKYSTDVDLLVQGFFRQEPYASYANYFSVFRVDVVSNESGASHPEREIKRDTALGAHYNCANIQRLVCVNNDAVAQVLSRSVPPELRDLVIVLVNDPEYGGSGGRYPVASLHPQVVELMLHEMGHTLGLLADEYSTGTCNPDVEPAAVNSTREISSVSAIKWGHWIAESTELPTPTRTLGLPGAYEGSSYCATGAYRPTFDSKMRSLGRSFDAVNTEQLIRRFYNFVSPIDGVFPAEGELTARGEVVDFAVERPLDLSVSWWLDGEMVGPAPTFSIDTSRLSPGPHAVRVEVRDDTPLVRVDSTQALVESARWTLIVR